MSICRGASPTCARRCAHFYGAWSDSGETISSTIFPQLKASTETTDITYISWRTSGSFLQRSCSIFGREERSRTGRYSDGTERRSASGTSRSTW